MANRANLATGTVLTAPSPATSGTSLVLHSGEGADMPSTPFFATVHPDGVLPTKGNAEIVSVTNVSTDTLTIVRAQKGTTAKTVAVDWRLSNAIYAEEVNAIDDHIADTTDAHDASAISYAGNTNLSSTDVEAALDELDNEKQPLDADLTTLATDFSSASASGPASLALREDTDNGTNKATIIAPASMAADRTITLPDATDTVVGKATTDDLSNKTLVSPLIKGTYSGWVDSNETWTYASGATTNVGTFTIAGVDLTGKYQAGDRVKFTQTTVKYAIITKVAFSTDTTITIYMGTDYTIANAAISANYYSKEKSPQGFPLSPTKWTESLSSGNNRAVSSTSLTSLSDALVVPIGAWRIHLTAYLQLNTTQAATRRVIVTLSSDASTETNPATTIGIGQLAASSTSASTEAMVNSMDNVLLTSATTFTLMGRMTSTTNASGTVVGTVLPQTIIAVSTYL